MIATIRSILLTLLLFAASACTTLQPIEMAPEELQQKISTENVLPPGKQAKLVTNDGRTHKVKIRYVDPESGVITTEGNPVLIADVIAVETKEFSIGKTALLAAGTYSVLALIALAVAPVFLL